MCGGKKKTLFFLRKPDLKCIRISLYMHLFNTCTYCPTLVFRPAHLLYVQCSEYLSMRIARHLQNLCS